MSSFQQVHGQRTFLFPTWLTSNSSYRVFSALTQVLGWSSQPIERPIEDCSRLVPTSFTGTCNWEKRLLGRFILLGLIFFLGSVSKKRLKWTNNSNEILSLEPSPEICSTNEELGGKKCLRMGEKKDLSMFSQTKQILLTNEFCFNINIMQLFR